MNDTGVDEDLVPLGGKIVLGIAGSILIFFAVVGNLLVIISYIRDKQLRCVMNFYILNLAIADLLIGLINIPVQLMYTISGDTWKFGKIPCKAILVNGFMMSVETGLLTLLITLDRVLLVKLGALYNVKETIKVAYVKVFISWIVAFSLYCPAIIGWDLWNGVSVIPKDECAVEFVYNFEYTFAAAMCEFVIAFVSQTILSIVIYYEIQKRGTFSKNQIQCSVAIIDGSESLMNKKEISNKTVTEQILARRNVRAAKALAVLILTFAICWGPYTIFTLVNAFCQGCVNFHLYQVSIYFLFLKSSLNPMLYAFNSPRFRFNFVQLMSIVCPKVSHLCRLHVCRRNSR